MSRHRRTARPPKTVLVYLLLWAVAFLTGFPFLWLLATSLKSANESIYRFPASLVTIHPTLANYQRALGLLDFSRAAFNSFFIVLTIVALNVVICSLAAYPLARLKFLGRGVVFGAIMITFMVPFQVIMVPLFLVALKLGIMNSYAGAILPMCANPFGIFLLRQTFAGIPRELEDAARIDGCSDLTLWWRVLAPLTKPGMAALAVLTFVHQWNEFLWPMIILKNDKLYPLPLKLLNLIQGIFTGNWRDITAAAMLTMLPVLIFFFLLQRYFLEGQTAGAVKG